MERSTNHCRILLFYWKIEGNSLSLCWTCLNFTTATELLKNQITFVGCEWWKFQKASGIDPPSIALLTTPALEIHQDAEGHWRTGSHSCEDASPRCRTVYPAELETQRQATVQFQSHQLAKPVLVGQGQTSCHSSCHLLGKGPPTVEDSCPSQVSCIPDTYVETSRRVWSSTWAS